MIKHYIDAYLDHDLKGELLETSWKSVETSYNQ